MRKFMTLMRELMALMREFMTLMRGSLADTQESNARKELHTKNTEERARSAQGARARSPGFFVS